MMPSSPASPRPPRRTPCPRPRRGPRSAPADAPCSTLRSSRLRSSSGTLSSERPSRYSRSNAWYTSPPPVLLPSLVCSRLKSGRPSSSSATTSPSTIACWASIQRGGLSRFGKYVSASLRLRVQILTLPSSTTACTRKPSHLISNSQSSSSNGLRRERREHRLDVLGHRRLLRAGEVDLGGRGRRLADPDRLALGLDLVVGAAGLDALGVVLGVPAGLGCSSHLWMSSHCSPSSFSKARTGSAPGRPARPDDREPALHLLAVDAELQLAVLDRLLRIERGRLGLPGPPVPDDDVAGAVLLGRDDPFEIEVFDGVVLDVDGHAPDLAVEAGALRDGPADEHALDLEAEVVVQPGGSVALDDEPPGRAGAGRPAPAPGSCRSHACGGIPRGACGECASRGRAPRPVV